MYPNQLLTLFVAVICQKWQYLQSRASGTVSVKFQPLKGVINMVKLTNSAISATYDIAQSLKQGLPPTRNKHSGLAAVVLHTPVRLTQCSHAPPGPIWGSIG